MGSIKMAKASLRQQNWPSDANRALIAGGIMAKIHAITIPLYIKHNPRPLHPLG